MIITCGVADLVSANIHRSDSYRLKNRDSNGILRQRDLNGRYQPLLRRERATWLKAKPLYSSSSDASSMSRTSSPSGSPRSQVSSQNSFRNPATGIQDVSYGIQEASKGRSKQGLAKNSVDDKVEAFGHTPSGRARPSYGSPKGQSDDKIEVNGQNPPSRIKTKESAAKSSEFDGSNGAVTPSSTPSSTPTSKGNRMKSWLPTGKGMFSRFRSPGRSSTDSGSLLDSVSSPSSPSSSGRRKSSMDNGGYSGRPVQYPIGGGEYAV